MQRLKAHLPMMANEGYRILSADKFVVETQRTRGGKDKKSNSDTRPYHFGEFDILAVSMQPSTGNWNEFLYTVSSWLLQEKKTKNFFLNSSRFQSNQTTNGLITSFYVLIGFSLAKRKEFPFS